MENLIIVHPNWDGNFDKALVQKFADRISQCNGEIVILIDSESKIPVEFEPFLSTKNIKLIDTIYDVNFGWVVQLGRISFDSAVSLFTSIRNKGYTSLTDENKESFIISHLIKQQGESDVKDLLHSFNNACLTLIDQLPENSVIIGGSIDACLKEIMVLMRLHEKAFSLEHELIYNN